MNYMQQVEGIREHLIQAHNTEIPDSYAALRHALFLTSFQHNDTSGIKDEIFGLTNYPLNKDTLTQISLQEFAFSQFPDLFRDLNTDKLKKIDFDETAILRGICRGYIAVESRFLFDQIGYSEQKNMLVREALRYSLQGNDRNQLVSDLRYRILAKSYQKAYFIVMTLLDIAAEFELNILKYQELVTLLRQWGQHEQVFLALLRYINAFQEKKIIPVLHMLFSAPYQLSLSSYTALIDTLEQFDSPESSLVMRRFDERISQLFDSEQALQLHWHLNLALTSMENQESLSASGHEDDIVLAQCMFQGLVGQPGKGNSGGLGVFLLALGDALAQVSYISKVYTLVLDPVASKDDFCQLCEQSTPNHILIKIPIYIDQDMPQEGLIISEYALRKTIEQTLKRYNIEPDIFHIRYSDIGSKIILDLAKQLQKKVVFTITPDPHRNMEERFAHQSLNAIQQQELQDTLQKVYISDYLLDRVDGLVAMPTQSGTAHLSAYFPQLRLSPELKTKPLRVIAEGIPLEMPETDEKRNQQQLLEKLFENPSEPGQEGYKISGTFRHHPMILNVGRLHPIKQQDLLVEAWASSDLWKTYNLVLVSGNLENPNETEQEMLARIENLITRYPHISGRLCFTSAMSNTEVRLLEQAIIQHAERNRPHVYVCSSMKEEFGIAVLEAMSAGFLLFGPERGGLSSYVHQGENGFLFDTNSAQTMAETLSWVLLDNQPGVEHLRTIAKAGQKTVRETFDIRQIAPQFAAFYQKIVTASQEQKGAIDGMNNNTRTHEHQERN